MSSKANAARSFTYTLSAGQELPIAFPGNFASCVTAGGTFEMAFDEEPYFEFEKGLSVSVPDGFKIVRIRNISGGAFTVKLYLAQGAVLDNRNVISTSVVTRSGDTIANAAVSVANTATLILAANTNRNRAVIQNNSGQDVFIGASGVTTANGVKVLPNGALAVETGAAVYGIVAAATSDVRVFEERS